MRYARMNPATQYSDETQTMRAVGESRLPRAAEGVFIKCH